MRILPKTPLWNRLVLSATVGGPRGGGGLESGIAGHSAVASGSRGVTVSELYPSGHVIIDEQRFEDRSKLGKIQRGEAIRVVEKDGLELIVERVE